MRLTYRRAHAVIVAFGLSVAVLLLALNAMSPADRPILKVSGADSVAYFANAHSLLFDFDFDLTNQNAVLRPTHLVGIRPQTGRPGSPWPIGFSLLEVPFLALGTFVDYLAQNPADGYSRYAITSYYLGNVVLMTIGLVCLFQLLYAFTSRELPDVSETRKLWICLLATLLVWPSTTLGYHSFSSLSHVAGFMAVTLMARAWWKAKDGDRPLAWALLGLWGGLTILCRWQNALLLLWPFLYEILGGRFFTSPRSWLNWPWLRARILFVGVAVACLVPQFIQWKAIYGKYVLNPQGDNFLQFPPRFIPNVLLSTRHGWFTWTPIIVLCVIGLLYGCYRARRIFIPLTTVLFLEVAVIGSLPTAWDMGEAFGMRALTCTLAISALGLVWLAFHASPRGLASLGVIVAACTVWSLVFAAQYRLDLLPKNDWLTSEELVRDKIFLKQAYARQTQVRQAKALLHQGRSAPAVEVLESAERRYGDSRFLLEVLTEAYGATGRPQEAGNARQRLQGLLDRRLY